MKQVNDSKRLSIQYPEIASEWHPTKNGALTPYQVVSGSSKKVWWKCSRGDDHEWKTTVIARTRQNTKCPCCANRKLSKTNSFSTLYPELLKQWHPTKNGDLNPANILGAPKIKVWWKCHKGDNHEWKVSIDSRTRPTGCPFCSNKRATSENNLEKIYPHLLKLWHPSKNGKFQPHTTIAGTENKIWWKCPKGDDHEWAQQPYGIANNDNPCPFCGFRRVCKDNNINALFPELVKEFDHEKNSGLSVDKILPNSGQRVWWRCKNDHEWITKVSKRTSRGQNCPYCSKQSSIPEIRIYTELMSIFEDVKNREKIDGVEVDIFIPSIETALEYDGAYFHKSKEKNDKEKNNFFKGKNIELLRIRELPLKKLSKKDLLVSPDGLKKHDLNMLLSNLFQKVNSSLRSKIEEYFLKEGFVNEKTFRKYISFFPSPFPEKSVEKTHPNLQEIWHQKNYPLELSNFSKGSRHRVWWKCLKNEEHAWEAPISTVIKGHRCPFCAGQKVGVDNNLYIVFPETASEWHPTKNGALTPYDISWASGKKVWWKCPKGEDHEWNAAVRHRTSNNSGCPFCSGNKISKDNNFGINFPELANEWHPTKNGTLTPYRVMPRSSKIIWWKCSENHVWKCSVSKRTYRNQNCNICYFEKRSKVSKK